MKRDLKLKKSPNPYGYSFGTQVMRRNPSLTNNWLQEILEEQKVVPTEFFTWQKEVGLSNVDLVPQQKFYTLCWKYHKRFKKWPPKELWEPLLEEANK